MVSATAVPLISLIHRDWGFDTLFAALAVCSAAILAFVLLLHTLFWGSGAAMLLLPTPWRRYWPVFAAPVGLTLQSLVVWTGAHVGLEGTSAYGRFALLLPALLLAAAATGMSSSTPSSPV